MTSNSKAGNTAPISAHRYFPAIVALWFAALFGLGSLVLPASLAETFVTALGLDSVVPALAPPHGFTARILIALAATVIGGIAGLLLARSIAAAQAHRSSHSAVRDPERVSKSRLRSSDQHPDAPARRPISALEELGEDRLSDAAQSEISQGEETGLLAAPKSGRRRALSLTHDEVPSDWLQHAPLPGVSEIPAIEGREFSEIAETAASDIPHGEDGTDDHHTDDALFEPRFEDRIAEAEMPDQPAPTRQFDAPAMIDEQPSAPPAAPVTHSKIIAAPIAQRPLAELGMAELVERLAYAMQNRETPGSAAFPEAPVSDAPNVQAMWEETDDVGAAELAELAAESAEIAPRIDIPAALQPIELTIGAVDEDYETPGFTFAERFTAPRADESRQDDGIFSGSGTDSGIAPEDTPQEIEPDAVMQAFGGEDAVQDEIEDDEATDYSSLLDLKTALSRPAEFVRIDEPQPEAGSLEPVVIFPGQEMRRFEAPKAEVARSAPDMQETGDAADDADQRNDPMPASAPVSAPESAPESAPVSSTESPPARPFDSPQSGPPRTDFRKPVSDKVADPAETERALRAALATLQRMSGAA